MQNAKTGLICALAAGICWGVISIFIRRLSAIGLNSFDIAFVRCFISAVLMGLYFLIKDRSLFRIRIKDIWMFIGTGMISLTFFSYCYFTTIVNAGAAVAVVLLYTSPVFVMLMSALIFKEKITVKKFVLLIVCVAGCAFVSGALGNSGKLSFSIILLGLGAGFGYSLYSVFGMFASEKYSSLTISFYTFLFSGISLIGFVHPTDVIHKISPNDLFYLLGISLVCTIIPYITYTIGLKTLKPATAAIIVTTEPVVGCILGLFVWKEEAGILKVIGILLILSVIILLGLDSMKEKTAH